MGNSQHFSQFKATDYSEQVVAGMNYLIKYSVGNGQNIEAKVYVPLPYMNSVPTVSYVIGTDGKKI